MHRNEDSFPLAVENSHTVIAYPTAIGHKKETCHKGNLIIINSENVSHSVDLIWDRFFTNRNILIAFETKRCFQSKYYGISYSKKLVICE